jgi:hypothetical protein
MNFPPSDPDTRTKRELLREMFLNAFSLALMKQAVLVPVRVEVREYPQDEVPEYYQG